MHFNAIYMPQQDGDDKTNLLEYDFSMPSALIIDDDSESLLELSEIARSCGLHVETAQNIETARRKLLQRSPEVAIVRIGSGGERDQDESFKIIGRTELSEVAEVYLVTHDPDYRSARRGMQVGASDYFHWPVDEKRLRTALNDLLEEVKASGNDILVKQPGSMGLLQGESAAMRRLYRVISRVAPTEATILLAGESGCGKELIARTMHELSNRSKGPFVAMNCGAIAGDLIESELFGHQKGAFTGAQASHRGFFERARGGTLLLDEVTEMTPDLQVKLLRVLETRQIRPVGGEKNIDIDVRIIASTNREPEEALNDGQLREDLYYRLAEFPVRAPPLRERGEDVILLAKEFLLQANQRETTNKTFAAETLDLLKLHDWPGNVRELKNAVSQAFILATDKIDPDDLPGSIPAGGTLTGDFLRFPIGSNLAEVERRMILATLEHHEGDKPRTAKELGISLKTLYNRLKNYR